MDFTIFSTADVWVGLLTLTILEIVLGIDNLVFISILSGKLPPEQRAKARQIGLALAVVTRIIFLLCIGWMMRLTNPLFAVAGVEITGKGLILLAGGLFLIAKATMEIHAKLEGAEHHADGGKGAAKRGMAGVIAQILVIDLVFSIDSVITAVGMVPHIEVMIIAVLIAVGVMLAFVNTISDFVEKHPTVKMLALAFLVLIGVNLIADGLGQHIPKGYTYFAMAFSVLVEMLNIRLKKATSPPVALRHNYPDETPDA